MTQYLLKLDCPRVSPDFRNFTLNVFPPPDDFPICVAADGSVISTYGDPRWNFSYLAGKSLWLEFGESPKRSDSIRLCKGNSALLRVVMAYYLYGDRNLVAPDTLRFIMTALKPIFKLCSDNGILVSELQRYPKVADQLASVLAPSKVSIVMSMLFELYNARETLGFTIIDINRIRDISKSAPKHVKRQHAYIPPRLWMYQIRRCREMLESFLEHREQFEALFSYCVGAYEKMYGSLEAFYLADSNFFHSPLSSASTVTEGNFADAAREFGVAHVIENWVVDPGKTIDQGSGVRLLSKYFGAVQFVGAVYLANFSGMRQAEVGRLRSDCLSQDHDERLGAIYLIRGETTKTIDDDHALWITSPTASLAVDAMKAVAKMRMSVAIRDHRVKLSSDQVENPYLITRCYEPWGGITAGDCELAETGRVVVGYREWKNKCPRLFDPNEIRISVEDMRVASQITPSIDERKFHVGAEWRFSLHQLRRSLNVNATHSGLVSLPSLQYEMKHQTPAMSLYYGQGHSRLSLNKAMTAEFVGTMLEALVSKATSLLEPEFSSPLGEKHKVRMVEFISKRSAAQLLALARSGELSIRETALGVCMSREYCPFGGIDFVVECTRCEKALIDAKKRTAIENLGRAIADYILAMPEAESPDRECLEAQHATIKGVLDVVLID